MSLWVVVLLATVLFFAAAWLACEFGVRRISRRQEQDRLEG